MRQERLARFRRYGSLMGIAPFALGLVLVIAPGLVPLEPVVVERALLGYGAMLLGWLGGVRWGLALLDRRNSDTVFALAWVGGLVGLIALLLPFGFGIALLTVGLAGQGAWDVWAGQRNTVPDQYASGRTGVTLLNCLLLLAILLAYASRIG